MIESAKFFPDAYTNFIGTISLVVAVGFLLFSSFQDDKSHTTKMFSIMVVVSLALFSSHVVTYFAAIFIVATAVTELEFLQNLAAIIRKDENYFKYKKEHPPLEESTGEALDGSLESQFAEDQSEDPDTRRKIDLSQVKDMDRTRAMRLALEVEDRALNHLEKEVGKIERAVGFSKHGVVVEFDGVAVNFQGKHQLIVEVKWKRVDEHPFATVMYSLRRFSEKVDKFTDITGESPDRYFVLVVNEKNSLSETDKDRLFAFAESKRIEIRLLTLAALGFDVGNQEG